MASATLGAFPSVVNLYVGDSAHFAFAPTVTFLAADPAVFTASALGDDLEIIGVGDGRAILFLMEGNATKAVTINVGRGVPGAPRRKAAPDATPVRKEEVLERELDKALRYSTDGKVQRGLLTMIARGSNVGGVLPDATLQLNGRSEKATYFASIRRALDPGDVPGTTAAFNRFDAAYVHSYFSLKLSSSPGMADFTAVQVSIPTGEAELRLGTNQLNFTLGTRGVLTRTGYFEPSAWRLRFLGEVRPGLSLFGGSLLDTTGSMNGLPFLGALYKSQKLKGRLVFGSNYGWDSQKAIGGAGEVDYRDDDCHLVARLGLTTSEEDVQYASYANGTRTLAFGSAACRLANRRYFDITLRRDSAKVRINSPFAGLTASFRTPVTSWILRSNLSWGVDDQVSTRFLSTGLGIERELDKALTLSIGTTLTLIPTPTVSEALSAAYRVKAMTLNGSLGLSHVGLLAPMLTLGLGAGYATPQASLEAGITAVTHPATGFFSLRLRASATYRPHPVWTLMGQVVGDPVSGVIAGYAGVVYAFGDTAPRDPLLSPFRSDKIRARVFEDPNGNGRFEPGEPLLEGVEVCVKDDCLTTNPDGEALFAGLAPGFFDVVVPMKNLAGATPTTGTRYRVVVGAYHRAEVEIGVRYRGRFRVRTYVDFNGNATYEEGADSPFTGLAVKVIGPSMGRRQAMAGSETGFDWTEKGPYLLQIDPMSVPAGYLANGGSKQIVDVNEYGVSQVNLGILALRSMSGRACVDSNGNRTCDATDPPLGLVHVQAGERMVETDADGNFLFTMLGAGNYDLEVPDIDLPAGLVPGVQPHVDMGPEPKDVTRLNLTFTQDLKVRRKGAVVIQWPNVGTATANELGSYIMSGVALTQKPPPAPPPDPKKKPVAKKGRDSGAPDVPLVLPSNVDQPRLRELAKLLKQKNTKFFVTVTRGTAVSPEQAEEDAQQAAANLARWFVKELDVPVADVVTELAAAASSSPVMTVRVYQLRAKL